MATTVSKSSSSEELKRSYVQAKESAATAHAARQIHSVPVLRDALNDVDIRLGAIGNASYVRDRLVQPVLQELLSERVTAFEREIVDAITSVSSQLRSKEAIIGKGDARSAYDASFGAEQLEIELQAIENTDVRGGNIKTLIEKTEAFLTKLVDVVAFLASDPANAIFTRHRKTLRLVDDWIPTTELLNTYSLVFSGSPDLEMSDSVRREGISRTAFLNEAFEVLERFSDYNKMLLVLIVREKKKINALREPAENKHAALKKQRKAFEKSKAKIEEINARIAAIDAQLSAASTGVSSTAKSLFSGFLGTSELNIESAMTDGLRTERKTLVARLAELE